MSFALDHFTAAGGPKIGFETQAHAWEFRKRRPGMKKKKAHQCLTCGLWHLDTRHRADEFQRWFDAH